MMGYCLPSNHQHVFCLQHGTVQPQQQFLHFSKGLLKEKKGNPYNYGNVCSL
jgi:hypothetical protein